MLNVSFVTGATGFVGSHVARALAAQGADLRLLVRSSSDLRNIQDLRAEQVTGDLRDAASLKKAVSGCDVVFHVAADYRLWVRDPDQMYRSNVEGTKAILEAARERKFDAWFTPRASRPWDLIQTDTWPAKILRFHWPT